MLEINHYLKSLIPALQKEEYELLEKSILKEGCRDSLILWDNIIIDGHNRYEICRKHEIPFNTTSMEFENLGQVIKWMINNQLARRNLTDSQRKYFIGKRYEEENKGHGGNREVASGNSYHLKTSEIIAKENNIGERTVRNNADYSKAIDEIKTNTPELAEKILREEIKLNNKEVLEISEQQPETQSKIVDLITTKQAKNYKEAKQTLSPEQEWLKKEYKQIDKEHDNHRLVANLINETKYLKIDEQTVKDYLNLVAVDCFKTEFIQNCDRLINKLNEMKAYHSNLNKIRRIK